MDIIDLNERRSQKDMRHVLDKSKTNLAQHSLRSGLVLKLHKLRRYYIALAEEAGMSGAVLSDFTADILDMVGNYTNHVMYSQKSIAEILHDYGKFKVWLERKADIALGKPASDFHQ